MNEETKAKLLDLLEEICGDDIVREEPELDLYEEGLLDSLLTIELLVAIEDAFSVSIAPTEVGEGEFSTPDSIMAFVSNHLK